MRKLELGAVSLRKNGTMPSGKWRRVTPCLRLAGVHHRKENGEKFARTAAEFKGLGHPYGLVIEREPSNEFYANALKVMGWVNGQSWHLGYVEHYFAAYCADRFAGAELAAEVHNVYCSPLDFEYSPPSSYVSVFYFICIPQNTPHSIGQGFQALLLKLGDELTFIGFAALTEDRIKWGARQYIWKYVVLRAEDLNFDIHQPDKSDFWAYIKKCRPSLDDVVTAVDRLSNLKFWPKIELLELAQIFVELSENKADKKQFKFGELLDLIEHGQDSI